MRALLALVVPILIFTWTRSRRRYPPGPKRLPLIGNLLQIPKRFSHEKYGELSKILDSDVVYLDAAGVPFIALNSLEACVDLLEKRSEIYSDRYHQTMAFELLDGRRISSLLPYGDDWREARKIMSKHLITPDQGPAITDFIHKSLLPNLLADPENFLAHIRNGVGGSIISMTYGLPIKRVNDPWIMIVEQAMHCLTTATIPGKYAVDMIPYLKYLPEWFPGAGFQKEAKEMRRIFARMFDEPLEAVKRGMMNGSLQSSFISRTLEDISEKEDRERLERVIANVGGTLIAGGNESAITGVINLIAVFLLFPDVRAKAQAEIDAVIGRGRLPELNDKPRLPYLSAVLKESLRWKPLAPIGVPHMSSKEDIYRGYYIPKGAIVIGNTWAIMYDEKTFPDPSKFDPTRFLTSSGQLDKNILDPEAVGTFGFGRRKCPGIDSGLASLWLSAACILACFDVSPVLDEQGLPLPPDIEYAGDDILLRPEPFKCRITPRDAQAIALVQAEYDGTSEYI